MKLIRFPELPGAQNVSDALRRLADQIDARTFEDAHNLVYAIDCGNGRVEVGLLGKSPEPGATAYLMLGLAKRKIEDL